MKTQVLKVEGRETGRSISGKEWELWLRDSRDLHKPAINGLN